MVSLQALQQQRNQAAQIASFRSRPQGRTKSVSAPVGGWNTRDGLTAMPEEDAIVLDNWFPDVGKVVLRKGYTGHATGVGAGSVETIAEYQSGNTRKLIAAGGGAIYDATSPGAASSLATGFSDNQWQTANFSAELHMVNGTDAPQMYDGSTVSAVAWSGVGLTISDLIGVNVFKERLFFIEKNSPNFWYAALKGVTGTLTKFPLSMVGNLGGDLIAMGTWTVDAGNGLDDMAVFVLSSGQIAVYAGTDPASAANWSLVGIYNIGAPIGRRGVAKLGSDMVIITDNDFVPLTRVLRQGRIKTKDDLSKISGAVIDAAKLYRANFGWQAFHYPRSNMFLFNVPISTTEYHQYVVNTVTGAWCRFKGMNGPAWGIYNDRLYFGGLGGQVYLADSGNDDNIANIEADARQAWTNLGIDSRKKFDAVRTIMESQASLVAPVGLSFDFGAANVAQSSASVAAGPDWDATTWDIDLWGPELVVLKNWRIASGTGVAVSPTLRVALTGHDVNWFRTDYRFKTGAAL